MPIPLQDVTTVQRIQSIAASFAQAVVMVQEIMTDPVLADVSHCGFFAISQGNEVSIPQLFATKSFFKQ